MNKKKIMIVDDNVDLCEMYKILLESQGYEILVSKDGLDALTRLVDYKPDLILLDIMMPQMNGIETLDAIKKLTTTIDSKIIIFTNVDNKKDYDNLLEAGADDYIIKSKITPNELFETIKKLIG